MKSVEAERKKAVGGNTDATKSAQLEKDYKSKMDDLSRQLDQQQREKQRKEDSI